MILAGLPANIFLFAQKTIDLEYLYNLSTVDKIDSLNIFLNQIYKDSSNLSKSEKGKLYFVMGLYNDKKDFEDLAFSNFKKAETIFTELNQFEYLADTHFELFRILKSKKGFDIVTKGYLDKLYQYSIKNKDKKRLLKSYMNFVVYYFNPNDFEKAKINIEKAIKLSIEINDTISLAKTLANKASLILNYSKKKDSVRYYYKEALSLYKQTKSNREEFGILLNIGTSYKNEKKYKDALKWYNKADNVKLNKYKNNYKNFLYGNIADTYEQIKDYKNAYKYLNLFINYKDSVNIEKQNVAIADLDTKYKTLEKDKLNVELKAENKKKQLYLIGVLGASVGLFVFGYLAYRNQKKKKEIALKNIAIEHQKVVSLVKDQELSSIDAMIEGQELERIKIAEDLHDNLGSALATLKLHFDNYRDNLSVKNEKEIKMLNSTENILDLTYNKVRTMAHANQASVLAEHSLIEAVKSLAKNISSANKTAIEVIDFGFDKSLNHTIELTMFRTIQELITNIIKHANAKKGIINLTLFDDSLGLIVEDDGVGFNINDLGSKVDGMGLNSIKKRVEKLEGSFTIDTNLGVGTSILIDIPIKSEI